MSVREPTVASLTATAQKIETRGRKLVQENTALAKALASCVQQIETLRSRLLEVQTPGCGNGGMIGDLQVQLREKNLEVLELKSQLRGQGGYPHPTPHCPIWRSTLPERDRTPTYTPSSPLRRSLLDPSYTPYSPGNDTFSFSPPEDRTTTAPYGNSPPTPYERGDYEELHQQAQKCIAQSRRTKALSQQSRAQTEKFYAQWRQSLASLDRTLAQSRRVSDETRAVLAQTPLATQRLDALALARRTSEHSDRLQARGGHSMDLTRSPGLPVVLPSPDRIEDVWIHIRYRRV